MLDSSLIVYVCVILCSCVYIYVCDVHIHDMHVEVGGKPQALVFKLSHHLCWRQGLSLPWDFTKSARVAVF